MSTGLEYNDYRGAVYAIPEYLHPTAWVGRAAVSFLEGYYRSEPFFLKISFHRPHSPYDPPKRWMDKFDPDKMSAPYLGDCSELAIVGLEDILPVSVCERIPVIGHIVADVVLQVNTLPS